MEEQFGRLPERQPLYRQVQNILLERILNGVYPEGFFLPNEYELSQEFRVSIGTVRKAVESLMEHRMVLRQQGRGTVVTYKAREADSLFLEQYRDPLGQKLLDWRQDTLSNATVMADADMAAKLSCNEGAELRRTTRRLTAAGHWRLFEECLELLRGGDEPLSSASPMVGDQRAPAGTVSETIALVDPGAEIALVLGCEPDDRVLGITTLRSNRHGRPFQHRRIWALGAEGCSWTPRQDR